MLNKEKHDFTKKVTVLIDTREQVNQHITAKLDECGITYESRKLDYGDYSFIADGSDFSKSCAIERKANVDEIYNNVVHDRGRIEKELYVASNQAKQFTMIIENVGSWEDLKVYRVPDWQMQRDRQRKVVEIGKVVNSTLRSWSSGNRYKFFVEFMSDKNKTASRMIEIFFWFWHNYKEQTAARR